MRAFSFSAGSTWPASSRLKEEEEAQWGERVSRCERQTADQVGSAYRLAVKLVEARRQVHLIRWRIEWSHSIAWNFPARRLDGKKDIPYAHRSKRFFYNWSLFFVTKYHRSSEDPCSLLTLTPDAFGCLIVATEDILMPVSKDFVYDFTRWIFNITCHIIQTRSIVALQRIISAIQSPPTWATYLNETNPSFVAQGAFDQHITVMIDPSFRRKNVMDAHRTFIPGDHFVIFRQDQCIHRIGKDFYEGTTDPWSIDRVFNFPHPSISPKTSLWLVILEQWISGLFGWWRCRLYFVRRWNSAKYSCTHWSVDDGLPREMKKRRWDSNHSIDHYCTCSAMNFQPLSSRMHSYVSPSSGLKFFRPVR